MAAPLPLCYLNGEYLPLAQARVSPLDRAFLFGDAVYEVMPEGVCADGYVPVSSRIASASRGA